MAEIDPPAGTHLEVMTLPEGVVRLYWPAEISKESLDELIYWLDGIRRAAERKARKSKRVQAEEKVAAVNVTPEPEPAAGDTEGKE